MTHGSESIAELLLARCGDQRDGLRTRQWSWTWDEVVLESAARGELARRWRQPDRPVHIGVLLENVPEYLFWLGGAALAGATIVGINPTRRGAQLADEVAHTDCQLIVTDAEGAALLEGLDLGVAPERIVRVDELAYAQAVADARKTAGEPTAAADVAPDTQMLLLLTSGTTGRAKAAICSQGRLARLGLRNSEKYEVGRDDVCYCPMPLFHGNALMACWAPALAAGGCVALSPRFSASAFLDDARAMGATFFTYVGKAISYVLAQPERDDDADNPLTHGFGTEAAPEDREAFRQRFGCELIEGYGSSEGAGHVARDPDAPAGALGRPVSDAVLVVDPTAHVRKAPAELDTHGRVANPDEAIGEIVDVEGAARFEGYYRDPAANAERVRHGWYWTGDLGYVDADGFLYFAGRAGDWIRVDSENVSALHIEQVVRRHPQVVLAGAYAVADPVSGDQVMVAIEPAAAGLDVDDLAAFLERQEDLGTKGMPRFLRVAEELPTTGSSKVLKRALQADGWACADPVYQRPGRGPARFTRMGEAGRRALVDELVANGRASFLPEPVAETGQPA